jgi:hypothetical protein
MSQYPTNHGLLKYSAEREGMPPFLSESAVDQDQYIDPRLLAISHTTASQGDVAQASNSTASETGSAASQGNHLGSPSDDSALLESG